MENILAEIFGEGRDLSSLQMAARAFVMFFIALVLIRISGMRSFGAKSALDNIIVIMLGAILSRPVVGVSEFFPTVAAAVSLCVTHRLLAMLCTRNHFLSDFLKGTDTLLVKDGEVLRKNMLKADITQGDLEAGLRLAGNVNSLAEVKEARLERTGQISVVKSESTS